jgi:hypothetical protein
MSELESSAAGPPASEPATIAEDQAWAAVLAAWDDEAVHRRYLARFTDVEGLAIAGGRYREVLAARPGDGVAERMRGEILKKATVYGLAALPRTPPPVLSPTVKRVRMMAALSLGSLVVVVIYKLVLLLGSGS